MRHKHTNNILIHKILYQSSPRKPGKATDQRIGLGEDLSKTKVRKGTSYLWRALFFCVKVTQFVICCHVL